MNNEKIWLSSPHIGNDELKFVQEAFDTNWVSPVGPNIDAFETELASYNGNSFCAALSSGTAAIHLALIILGVKQGDEVICSTFTFSGSCNPIVYLNATPVFIDSEKETWNMDPDLLEAAINDRIKKTGKRPKAIIVVHLYGIPAQMVRIMAVAKKYDIPVIEDAAEALGSKLNNKKLGGFGDFGIYSFNGNKIITTSGGGALVSENQEWIKKAKFLATQARDPEPHYEHTEIGYNYRLSNICAGIGRGQLKVLDERVKQRRAVYAYYLNHLGNVPWITFLKEQEGSFSNRWLTTVLLNSYNSDVEGRELVRKSLEQKNIESRPLWKPMHLQPIFKAYPAYTNGNSDEFFKTGLCLPSGSNLLDRDLDRVIDTILEVTGDWFSG
jgi:dTDP-4-amino-4,6-dideoxygalactose transaminase